jgi:hypothetical protein
MEELKEYRARGTDDEVHVVEAPAHGLVDPSPYQARCGQPVIELYNDDPGLTCRRCAERG